MVAPAFVPATALPANVRVSRAVASRPAPHMSLRKNVARLAAIPTTLATIAPVLASEGTGEGFGIDTPLLFLPFILVPGVFLALFLQFDGAQDKEDFIGEYDERRR